MYRNNFHKQCTWLIAAMTCLTLFFACTPDKGINANLFAINPDVLTVAESETAIIAVSGGTDFDISTDNGNAACTKNSDATISVTGVKVGSCTLTVTKGDESLTCQITIERSAAQKDFLIYATPRVENWLSETLNTETTPGLQVSCEKGIDASGWERDDNTTAYGFYFTETGQFLRLSAEGDFSARGTLNNGIIALRDNNNSAVEYILCEKVSIDKVSGGKLWITASMPSRSDIRIVTETF